MIPFSWDAYLLTDYLWLHSDLVFSCKLVLKFDGLHLETLYQQQFRIVIIAFYIGFS